MSKRVITFLRYLLMALAFIPLARVVVQEWDQIGQSFLHLHWISLGWALILLFLIMPLMAFISWVSLHYLGVKLPIAKVLRIYFLSQVPKYLPGGIWAFPGRMLAYQMAGVHRALAMISVFREVAVLFLGAVIVGWGGLFLGSNSIGRTLPEGLKIAVILGVIFCAVIIALSQLLSVWQWLWSLPERVPFLKRVFERWSFLSPAVMTEAERRRVFNLHWLPVALACSVLFWLALGLPFRQLILAVDPAIQTLSGLQAVFQSASLFALAWSVGFAIVFVPAGMGVRESVLVVLLSQVVASGDAASAALLSRLWWMAIEAIYVVLSLR